MSFNQYVAVLFNPNNPGLMAESIAILLFALAFFVVGVLRVVEFKGIGLKPGTRRFLITLHLIGCVLFAASLVFGAASLFQDQRKYMFGCFILSMLMFAPGQFMIGVRRSQPPGP